MLDVLPRSILDDDRVDPGQVEQVREEQAGRSGADDPYFGAHRRSRQSSGSVSNGVAARPRSPMSNL